MTEQPKPDNRTKEEVLRDMHEEMRVSIPHQMGKAYEFGKEKSGTPPRTFSGWAYRTIDAARVTVEGDDNTDGDVLLIAEYNGQRIEIVFDTAQALALGRAITGSSLSESTLLNSGGPVLPPKGPVLRALGYIEQHEPKMLANRMMLEISERLRYRLLRQSTPASVGKSLQYDAQAMADGIVGEFRRAHPALDKPDYTVEVTYVRDDHSLTLEPSDALKRLCARDDNE